MTEVPVLEVARIKAEALRDAAVAIRDMHDPPLTADEETADWLIARAAAATHAVLIERMEVVIGDGHFQPPTHGASGPCCMTPQAINQITEALAAAGIGESAAEVTDRLAKAWYEGRDAGWRTGSLGHKMHCRGVGPNPYEEIERKES